MKPAVWIIATGLIAAGAGAGGFWLGRHHEESAEPPSTQPAEEEKPVAEVSVVRASIAPIEETIVCYGSVVAQSGDVQIISVPFESRVTKLMVSPGQQIEADAQIAQVEPSPDALVTFAEAKNALAAAERDLQQAQQRFNEHLATNTELSQAQQAQQSAQLKLQSMTNRGVAPGDRTIKAPSAGIVSKIDVQVGQIVAFGAPVVEIASGKGIEVMLGVEPGDLSFLKPGMPVDLKPVDRMNLDAVRGQIRLVSQRVDPATRLASVMISLPSDQSWLLDTFVSGRIVKQSASGLIVPRQAVLRADDGSFSLFNVKDGHAVKHDVRIGLQTDRDVQVISDNLTAGDSIVVAGNYQLEDGMTVQLTEPATQPTTGESKP